MLLRYLQSRVAVRAEFKLLQATERHIYHINGDIPSYLRVPAGTWWEKQVYASIGGNVYRAFYEVSRPQAAPSTVGTAQDPRAKVLSF